MLLETMKRLLIVAIKEKDEARRDILRLVIADVEADHKRKDDDKWAESVIRKHFKNNDEALAFYANQECLEAQKLSTQTICLNSLLPKTLTVAEIREALKEIEGDLVSCDNDGKAMGMAVGFFKKRGDSVLGEHVKGVVTFIRTK